MILFGENEMTLLRFLDVFRVRRSTCGRSDPPVLRAPCERIESITIPHTASRNRADSTLPPPSHSSSNSYAPNGDEA